MLRYFLYLLHINFTYIEFDFIILYSKYGIIKIKNSILSLFFYNSNVLFSILVNKNVAFFFEYIFKLINYGHTKKFTLVGIGYRQYHSNNIVVYKLWYNHLIYKILPLYIITSKKGKKRKYFSIFSLHKNKLNNILHLWLSYRIMNIYTKKGFLKRNTKYFYKPVIKRLV